MIFTQHEVKPPLQTGMQCMLDTQEPLIAIFTQEERGFYGFYSSRKFTGIRDRYPMIEQADPL